MNKLNSLTYLQIIPENLLLTTINEINIFNNSHIDNEIISEYKFNYNLLNFNNLPTPKSPLK